jgi:3D (Asp-Asp-Asp) domain-containing protein
VYREIVDAKFTIENIGEVSKEVKSKVSPSAFMSWSCSAWAYKRLFSAEKKFTYGLDDHTIEGTGYTDLLSWAIIANDMELFRFLTDLDVEWTHRLGDKSESSTGVPSFYLSDFNSAIKYGRLEMLADMIRYVSTRYEVPVEEAEVLPRWHFARCFQQALFISTSLFLGAFH